MDEKKEYAEDEHEYAKDEQDDCFEREVKLL